MRLLAFVLAVLGAAVLAQPVLAHNRSESFSKWQINDNIVSGTITFAEREATRIPHDGEEAATRVRRTLEYLSTHVGLARGSDECSAGKGPRALPSSGGFMRVEFTFACPEGEAPLVLSFHGFFDLIATHMHMARVRDGENVAAEFLFTQGAQELAIQQGAAGPEETQSVRANFVSFVPIGMEHILSGIDHLLFLFGIMLVAARGRDIALAITGFTLGHSVTLALATLKIVDPNAAAVEAAIGFTIALVAVEFLGLKTAHLKPMALGMAVLLAGLAVYSALQPWAGPPAMMLAGFAIFSGTYLALVAGYDARGAEKPLRVLRLSVTTLFGLIHGFGFAGNLLAMNLPSDRIFGILAGFNVGVELGQIVIVAAAFFAARAAVRIVPRLATPFWLELTASGLVAMGVFWFLERSYT